MAAVELPGGREDRQGGLSHPNADDTTSPPETQRMNIRDQILDLSRQTQMGGLSPWFDARLDALIATGTLPDEAELAQINEKIIEDLISYRIETGVSTVIIGMSGGVDSALVAALFKKAGWRVIGATLPIDQVQAETDRGIEACQALNIQHQHIDLSNLYRETVRTQFELDGGIYFDNEAASIRRGNMRARLRMVTLYNLASMNGGLVASTDNLSELAAGFWTLHGDVGDLSPIQSLLKSWEVPYLARLNGVPESTVRAKPTDGLGISDGDEAQLGCSYLEWDIMFLEIQAAIADAMRFDVDTGVARGIDLHRIAGELGLLRDSREEQVFRAVTRRMGATWFKRRNPLNVAHPLHNRYEMMGLIDESLFVVPTFKGR